jgi:hypothetical protein
VDVVVRKAERHQPRGDRRQLRYGLRTDEPVECRGARPSHVLSALLDEVAARGALQLVDRVAIEVDEIGDGFARHRYESRTAFASEYDAPVPAAPNLADASLVDAFRRDGAVCVRGALTPAEIAIAERGIERNLASPSARALVASQPDDPGRFFEDFCNWQRIEEVESLCAARLRPRSQPLSLAVRRFASTTTMSW